MKFKVFGIIFISYICVILVGGVGQSFGKYMKKHMVEMTLSEVYGSEVISDISREQLNEIIKTSDDSEKIHKVSMLYAEKFKWYFIVSMLIQGALIILTGMLATKYTIKVVMRSEKL